jgi:hypothetical protein
MFAGDKTKWAKFGNTLKLRLLVHLKNVAGFDFAGEAAKIVANGKGYLGAGENAQVQPGYKSDKPNPFYNLYVADPTGTATQNSVYYKANSYAISYYEYDFDPRETRFYKAGNQGMRGVAYGLPSANENTAASLSAIGDGVAKTNSSVQWILTATESLFLQAEAMQRGYITGNPVTTLNAAITESFALVGATGAAAYIAGNATYPDVDITASSNKYYTILQQKWFALNAIAPYEVWTDYRRENSPATGTQAAADHFIYGGHGYPVAGANPVDFAIGPPISVSPSNTATKIPIRLLYPQNEYNYNAANVGAEGTISANTSKIFWDN